MFRLFSVLKAGRLRLQIITQGPLQLADTSDVLLGFVFRLWAMATAKHNLDLAPNGHSKAVQNNILKPQILPEASRTASGSLLCV
jgi:hypothetical protein